LRKEEVQKVKEAIKEACGGEQPVLPIVETGPSCCCG